MVRTEFDDNIPLHHSFSIVVVPTDACARHTSSVCILNRGMNGLTAKDTISCAAPRCWECRAGSKPVRCCC